MCAHGEMHPTFPIHWTHQRCHTISTQPGIMPLTPASSWCLRANKSHSCLSLHLFGKKNPQQPKQTPPSSFLFHNNNTAANCAMLRSGWKCLPDPCVQLVSSQEHEIWLFLPLSSLVQPQVLLSLLHFSDRLFFFPLKISLNLPESLQRGAPQRCAASRSGEQHQPATGFHVASGPLDVSAGLPGRGGGPCKGVEVEELHERSAEEKFARFNEKKRVVWLNLILFWLRRHPAPSCRMRRQAPEKSRSATLARGTPALSTRGLVEY